MELEDAFQLATESVLSDVNTCMPGIVISFDGSRATCRPSVPKQLADGSQLSCPQVVDVPVVWPTADIGGLVAGLRMPLKPGDGVLLHFSQRSLETWLQGGDTAPDDPRRFDLSDAVAVPGLNRTSVRPATDSVELFYGPAGIEISPVGTMTFNAPGGYVFNGGGVSFMTGGVSHNGKNIGQDHRHRDVQAGSSISGVPV